MKNQSLKLFELLNLEAELAGATNSQTGEKIVEGLLNQKLSVTIKYHLNNLVEVLATEKKVIDSLRDELIKKHGTEDENGNVGISMVIETEKVDDKGEPIKDINPAYIAFNDEYGELLNQEKDIKLPQIKLSDLDKIETKDNYVLVFKYLIKEEIEELTAEEV
jgi:molybdopterin converting factor small subunit